MRRDFRRITECFLEAFPWANCSPNDTTQEENDVWRRVYKLDEEKPKTHQFFQLPFDIVDGNKEMDDLIPEIEI